MPVSLKSRERWFVVPLLRRPTWRSLEKTSRLEGPNQPELPPIWPIRLTAFKTSTLKGTSARASSAAAISREGPVGAETLDPAEAWIATA